MFWKQPDKLGNQEKGEIKANIFEAEKVSNYTTVLPVKKSVSFDLKQTQNIPPSTKFKPIVFNGTFPIDWPIKYEAESNEFIQDYMDDQFYYREDDGEENDEIYSDNDSSSVLPNFLVNKRIAINYKKLCTDVENSITQFENILNERRKPIYLRTFEIDAPIEHKKGL